MSYFCLILNTIVAFYVFILPRVGGKMKRNNLAAYFTSLPCPCQFFLPVDFLTINSLFPEIHYCAKHYIFLLEREKEQISFFFVDHLERSISNKNRQPQYPPNYLISVQTTMSITLISFISLFHKFSSCLY